MKSINGFLKETDLVEKALQQEYIKDNIQCKFVDGFLKCFIESCDLEKIKDIYYCSNPNPSLDIKIETSLTLTKDTFRFIECIDLPINMLNSLKNEIDTGKDVRVYCRIYKENFPYTIVNSVYAGTYEERDIGLAGNDIILENSKSYAFRRTTATNSIRYDFFIAYKNLKKDPSDNYSSEALQFDTNLCYCDKPNDNGSGICVKNINRV